jgi:O-antigen ligase
MLAALVAIAAWIALGEQRRRMTVALVATLVTVIAIFGTAVIKQQSAILEQALSYRGQTSSSNPALNSIASRASIYETGWAAFRAEPLVGFGLRVPTEQAQSPIFTRYGKPYAFESYLVVLPVESGVTGTILFALFIATLLIVAVRRFSERRRLATVAATLVGGLALSVGANPFDVPVSYMWILIGICFGAGLSKPSRPAGARADGVEPE